MIVEGGGNYRGLRIVIVTEDDENAPAPGAVKVENTTIYVREGEWPDVVLDVVNQMARDQ